MEVSAVAIIKRYQTLKAQRGAWEKLWDEVATYVMPNKADFVADRPKGDKRGIDVYDSTAIQSNQLLAASLQGSLTPSSARWFDLNFRSDDLNDNKDAKEWLQECADIINTEFNQSNFNTASGEAYQDLGAFGTAPMLFDIKEKNGVFDGFLFQSLHLGGVLIDESHQGKVDTVFRTFKLTARQAHQKWGDAAGAKVIKSLDKEPDKLFEFLQVCMPREVKGEIGLSAPPKMRPIACYYISLTDKKIILETGYYEMPIMSPRWGKITGDVYGYSPALTARADIRTLNEARRLSFVAWEKSIDPPLIAEQNAILGKFSFKHSTVSYVKDLNGIREMPQGTNWNADQLMLSDVRQSVRRIFFSDQLELQSGPNMTATEVNVRYELMQRMLGSTFGRLQSEFLTPLVERAFYAMYRANALPEAPQSVIEMGGDLDIEYIGALARSQRMEDVTNIQRLYAAAMELAQAKPEVLDMLDADEALSTIARRLGTPADIVKAKDVVAEERQARAQQQQQMAQAQEEQVSLDQAGQVQQLQQ